jgi:hypothetical protein
MMAINYTIQAEIIDIKGDVPESSDIFFVDSNVWFFLTYSQPNTATKTRVYSNYIDQVRQEKATLHRCGLCLSELAHSIERTERKIFMEQNGMMRNRHFTKEYRHNYSSERIRVTQEIQTAWGTVKTLTEPIDVLLDDALTDNALSLLCSCPIDGYDTFLVEAMKNSGVIQIITDDGDFSTIPNIKVFTANNTVIQSAKTQGKLITR